jgi:ubiquitin C-terminal hydrolase
MQQSRLQTKILNGRFETEAGCYTLIAVNRFDINNPGRKKMNRLELSSNNQSLTGHQLIGQIVSCVCHRGPVDSGHFVSYHKVNNQWYLNNDSQPCQVAENPFEQTVHGTQSVELLFYTNNV